MDNVKLDGIPANTKETFFYIVFQVFKVLLIKIYKTQPPQLFISFCSKLVFTSGDIIFHKFLELHSTLSKKIFLSQIFLFLTDLLKPTPTPLTAKIY